MNVMNVWLLVLYTSVLKGISVFLTPSSSTALPSMNNAKNQSGMESRKEESQKLTHPFKKLKFYECVIGHRPVKTTTGAQASNSSRLPLITTRPNLNTI